MTNEDEIMNEENIETIYLNLKDLADYLPMLEQMMDDLNAFYEKHIKGLDTGNANYEILKQRLEVSLEYAYALKEKLDEGTEIDKEELSEMTQKIVPLIVLAALSQSEYLTTNEGHAIRN